MSKIKSSNYPFFLHVRISRIPANRIAVINMRVNQTECVNMSEYLISIKMNVNLEGSIHIESNHVFKDETQYFTISKALFSSCVIVENSNEFFSNLGIYNSEGNEVIDESNQSSHETIMEGLAEVFRRINDMSV